MKDYKDLCTVLVNSCDLYEEAWKPFFELFRRFWPNCPFDIVLATQTKTFDAPYVKTVHTNEGVWSQRINNALRQINTPFVLLFLEDYFLLAPVKQAEFLDYFNMAINDENLGAIFFNRIGGYRIPSDKYIGLYDMNKTNVVKYHLNCQISLWNKKIFEEATLPLMSPWDFELEGFSRVSENVRNKGFYCSQTTVHTKIQETDIFSYLVHPKNGIGISKSKWLWNNRKLFLRYGIECDCSSLDYMSHSEYLVRVFLGKALSIVCKSHLYKLYLRIHAREF